MPVKSELQKAFVREYLIDLNAFQAAKRAGYSDPNWGRQLLSKPNVSEAIQKAIKKRSDRTEITQDMVLKEYARMAFLDPRKFYDKNDNLKKIVDLDDDTAACLAGMDVVISKTGDADELEFIKKIKIIDKRAALDSLAKHLDMTPPDKLEVTGPDGKPMEWVIHLKKAEK